MTGGKLWADLEDNGGPTDNILNADENLNMWRDNANPHPQVSFSLSVCLPVSHSLSISLGIVFYSYLT